ncbi:MAG: M48 family metalloprotease [Actinomycetota bacterium]
MEGKDRKVSEWDAPAPVPGRLVIPFGLVLLAIVLLALLVGAVTTSVIGIVFGALLMVAFLAWIWSRGRAALKAVGARPLEDSHHRLRNLVEGLSRDLHIAAPAIWVIEAAGPNALVSWAGGPHVVVTTGLVATYTRTELEAVVAHCLVRIATGDVRRAVQATGLGPLSGRTVKEGRVQDLQTVSLTRYPPALASAIRKAEPQGGGFGLLWFVGSPATHVPAEDRAAALLDL